MYYPIDETTARRANDMNSMRDYRPGSATAEYRAAVDKAAALVEQRKQKVSPFYHDKLDGLLERYSRRLAAYYNDYYRNEAACPSILISGGSNFPVRKKEKQNSRRETLMHEYNEIQGILDKIKSVGTGPIDPTDPHAREMWVDRLQRLQSTLDRGKAMNAHFRKHKTMKGFPDMDDETAAELDEAISRAPAFAQTPFPDFELASLRGKIKRAQENLSKLDSLEQHKDDAANTLEFDGGKIFLNMEANRLQILFDEIPSDETRAELKSHGFKWSRKNEAWQRQLTRNAIYDAKHILGITDTKRATAADEGDAAQQAAPLATPSAEDKTAEIRTASDGQALMPLA